METFSPLIGVATAGWQSADAALKSLAAVDKENTAALSEALLKAQLQVGIATSLEQKASAVIDKAYQAHSQVASR